MGLRLVILWVWKCIDPLFYFLSRLHYIQPAYEPNSIFRVRITRYRGNPLVLSDGTRINKNDLLLKIHLHNIRLLLEFLKIKNEVSRSRQIYKTVLYSMPSLATYLKYHPMEKDIKGVIGITTINKGVRHLGFECFLPTNWFYRCVKKWGQLPISLLSSTSIKSFQKHKITYLIMSKEKLYNKYILQNPNECMEVFPGHKLARSEKH